jgi:hypothetical protein
LGGGGVLLPLFTTDLTGDRDRDLLGLFLGVLVDLLLLSSSSLKLDELRRCLTGRVLTTVEGFVTIFDTSGLVIDFAIGLFFVLSGLFTGLLFVFVSEYLFTGLEYFLGDFFPLSPSSSSSDELEDELPLELLELDDDEELDELPELVLDEDFRLFPLGLIFGLESLRLTGPVNFFVLFNGGFRIGSRSESFLSTLLAISFVFIGAFGSGVFSLTYRTVFFGGGNGGDFPEFSESDELACFLLGFGFVISFSLSDETGLIGFTLGVSITLTADGTARLGEDCCKSSGGASEKRLKLDDPLLICLFRFTISAAAAAATANLDSCLEFFSLRKNRNFNLVQFKLQTRKI